MQVHEYLNGVFLAYEQDLCLHVLVGNTPWHWLEQKEEEEKLIWGLSKLKD